ncbi:MAG TPA: MBL fold metallo-hydrolase [Solimonas sp.]|nr:MBL fold metallo-hydrolase [Solimonas sp.]
MNAKQSLPPAQDLGYGITCIDTLQERPGLACCYLVGRDGEYAFIEAGTAHGVPRLLALLAERGIAREQVRYVIPTHVHLDHAGGAGVLMRELPAATLVAHPRGARHLIDPSKLIAGAESVYGKEAVAQMYGEIAAIAEARVIVAGDDHRLPLGQGELRFIDSPGHARHHFSIWDETSRGFFTGDTFGLSYREFDGAGGPYLFATTTPVQFEPEAWFETLERYLSFDPQRMYLTHFSVVENVAKLAADLRASLQRYVALATPLRGAAQRHQALLDALNEDALAVLRALGNPMPEARVRELLAFDLELNVQGLEVWLDRPT